MKKLSRSDKGAHTKWQVHHEEALMEQTNSTTTLVDEIIMRRSEAAVENDQKLV
jgi:hypothetical protein